MLSVAVPPCSHYLYQGIKRALSWGCMYPENVQKEFVDIGHHVRQLQEKEHRQRGDRSSEIYLLGEWQWADNL